MPNNAAASGGSNLGPTNPALIDAAKARIDQLKTADPGNPLPIPVDLVTASASGLDPHISPQRRCTRWPAWRAPGIWIPKNYEGWYSLKLKIRNGAFLVNRA